MVHTLFIVSHLSHFVPVAEQSDILEKPKWFVNWGSQPEWPAALQTSGGKVFSGVCVDASSGMGFCAEANAIGSMLTNGDTEISKIVAVWRDELGKSYVVAPCGRRRQFMLAVNKKNIDSKVIVATDKEMSLRELLPLHESYSAIN